MLIFSYLGLTSKALPALGAAEKLVISGENSILIDEVVVIGFGFSKRSNICGSVAFVTFEDY